MHSPARVGPTGGRVSNPSRTTALGAGPAGGEWSSRRRGNRPRDDDGAAGTGVSYSASLGGPSGIPELWSAAGVRHAVGRPRPRRSRRAAARHGRRLDLRCRRRTGDRLRLDCSATWRDLDHPATGRGHPTQRPMGVWARHGVRLWASASNDSGSASLALSDAFRPARRARCNPILFVPLGVLRLLHCRAVVAVVRRLPGGLLSRQVDSFTPPLGRGTNVGMPQSGAANRVAGLDAAAVARPTWHRYTEA